MRPVMLRYLELLTNSPVRGPFSMLSRAVNLPRAHWGDAALDLGEPGLDTVLTSTEPTRATVSSSTVNPDSNWS